MGLKALVDVVAGIPSDLVSPIIRKTASTARVSCRSGNFVIHARKIHTYSRKKHSGFCSYLAFGWARLALFAAVNALQVVLSAI